MRSHTRFGRTATAAVGLLLLSGCGGFDAPEPEASDTHSSGSTDDGGSGADSALRQAFSRIDLEALGEEWERHLEFGETSALVTLADEDERWTSLTFLGQGFAVSAPQDVEALGFDGEAADYAVTAGMPPSALYLVSGGQDSEAIESGAKELGYEDDDGVLTHTPATDIALSITAPQLAAEGSDVLLGGPSADLGLVALSGDSGGGLLEDPVYAALADCLGDVPAAMATDRMDDGNVLGVGVQGSGDEIESVICVVVGDDGDPGAVEDEILTALNDGDSLNGYPYSEVLTDPASDVDRSTVKVTAQNSTDAKPMTILQMLQAWDVPGVTKK